MGKDVLLKNTFPQLLLAGASGRPPPLDWWPTQTNRQGHGGALGPHVIEQGGRATDEEDRLLTKHCIERQWKNTSLEKLFMSEMTSVRSDQVGSNSQLSTHFAEEMCTPSWVKEARVPESDVVLFPQIHTCLTTVNAAHIPLGFLSLNDRKRDDSICGAVGTSTNAVACFFASQPQLLFHAHPSELSLSHKNPPHRLRR